MKDNLGKVQIVIAVVAAIYFLMPDLFVGPIDDAAVVTIAGIVEAVLLVLRALPSSVSDTDSNNYYENTF